MPRKRLIPKKKLSPDPVYNSLSVSKFTNMIMFDGKKRVAEKILYSALEILAKNSKEDPITMMDKALQNVSPSVEVKSRRVGGSNYQVPVEVNTKRKQSLAMRWILEAADKRNEKTMKERVANEIIDAFNNKGNAVKKKRGNSQNG